MSDSEHSDVTWEEFFGTTTDLMPTLLGMYDALLDTNKNIPSDVHQKSAVQKSGTPVKKSAQVNHFTNLSPTVQKMLANISDQNENTDAVKDCSEDHSCKTNIKSSSVQKVSRYLEGQKCMYSSTRIHRLSKYSEQKSGVMSHLNKSTECLSAICDNVTTNVQKMLSNIPDQDLVISSCTDGVKKQENVVLCDSNSDSSSPNKKQFNRINNTTETNGHSSFLYKLYNSSNSKSSVREMEEARIGDTIRRATSFNIQQVFNGTIHSECNKRANKSLSPHLSSGHKFKSRTIPGNYLQVPQVNNETNSEKDEKEVSRPVSLSSLGSCSSSGSSGPTQPSSMYLASTESLDSDPEPNGSQGSADSGIAEHPVMSPEQRVLQEVLDTENVYVTDLKQVVEGYLQQWRSTPDCPLASHLSDLFSNIEEIYEFNRKFLDELYEAGNDATFIANAFIQNDSGFRIYTEYCTHYPRIMATLTELTRDEAAAKLIRERQTALGHALPLGSYLLKPVQRILKYHLLLQRLLKLCDQQQRPSIDLALQTMTSIAGHINHMKGKHEHAVRVQEIQSQLYGWTGDDLTAMGELCAEGTFRVGGARGYRQVFLFDKVLLITKSKSDGALAYKFHIMCSNLMLVESVRGEPLSFHVIPFDNPRFQVTLRAKSLEHKREWTLQLKRVILENYNAVIPSHARQLVMQLGQDVNITNDNAPVDKWGLPKQHSTPQYLERQRTRVRKSRDTADRRAASHDRAFASLAAWRRKSEPNVAHYNTKTLPKKISKIKKAKERGAKFYTDLSDSETCDVISESNDSLAECKNEEVEESEATLASNTLEHVVSQLLMQNQEFQKILNRQKKVVKDENSGVWLKQNICDKPKADSLPRSFQLNEDQSVIENQKNTEIDGKLQECDTSLDTSEINEDDEEMYPDHKIYRKSAIRFSLVQRFRAIISEEETKRMNTKLPTYKQGSELMGAKIAQPDYADPQKLFGNYTNSQLSLNNEDTCTETEKEQSKQSEIKQGKKMFEAINLQSMKSYCIDTGQKYLKIKSPLAEKKTFCDSKSSENSSQPKVNLTQNSTQQVKKSLEKTEYVGPSEKKCTDTPLYSIPACSDSYYEKILEHDLNSDEKIKSCLEFTNSKIEYNFETMQNNRNISVNEKKLSCAITNVSINNTEQQIVNTNENQNEVKKFVCTETKQSTILKPVIPNPKPVKRPLKPPPPVPAKPARISQIETSEVVPSTKGWVKTVVGRFE